MPQADVEYKEDFRDIGPIALLIRSQASVSTNSLSPKFEPKSKNNPSIIILFKNRKVFCINACLVLNFEAYKKNKR